MNEYHDDNEHDKVKKNSYLDDDKRIQDEEGTERYEEENDVPAYGVVHVPGSVRLCRLAAERHILSWIQRVLRGILQLSSPLPRQTYMGR